MIDPLNYPVSAWGWFYSVLACQLTPIRPEPPVYTERRAVKDGTWRAKKRSTETPVLGRDPMDFPLGHHFWDQRRGSGRGDKQGGDLVEFGCVLWDVLPFDDMGFSGLPSRAALR